MLQNQIHYATNDRDLLVAKDAAKTGRFASLRIYNPAASAILSEAEMQFDHILFQLSNEKGEAIEASIDISQNVMHNLGILREQVERGTT